MKIIIISFLLTFINLNTCAQVDDLPPTVAEPSAKNKVLIDQLVDASNFEIIFKEYCVLAINLEGRKKSWNAEEIKLRNAKINFSQFMNDSGYNAFSDLTTRELKSMIKLAKKINNNRKEEYQTLYFFSNTIIQNNLMFYVKSHCLE